MKHRACRVGLVMLMLGCGLLLTLTLLSRQTRAQGGSVLYVAPGGDCGGLSPCYAHPQDAVDAASDGHTIKVAARTYSGVSTREAVTQVVYVSKSVTIQGGYTTTNWAFCDPVANPTTLDALDQGRVFYITDGISPAIENLSIVNGDATGMTGTQRFAGYSAGGGMYALSATVTMTNTIWSGNRADLGGAACAENSHFTLLGSTIISNDEAQLGGGLFLEGGDSLLADNVVENNKAEYGGGLAVYEGQAELTGNRIVGNHSWAHGGGVLFWQVDGVLAGNIITGNVGGAGGGASLQGDVSILHNLISHNSGDFGAGLALWEGSMSLIGNTIAGNQSGGVGGGISISYHWDMDPQRKLLLSNIISGNLALTGGGLFMQCTQPVLLRNLIHGNAAREGGGLFANTCRMTMDSDTLTGNTAEQYGGALAIVQYSQPSLRNLFLTDNQAGANGSALFVERSSLDLLHTTMVNSAGPSGILVQSGPLLLERSAVAITNTILASHTVGITVTAGSTATLEGTLWYGNGQDTGGDGAIITGTINVYGEPAFVDPDADDYHIGPTSAAIDRGVEAGVRTDIDHQPRPCRIPDLGADEYWPPGVLKYKYLPVLRRESPASGYSNSQTPESRRNASPPSMWASVRSIREQTIRHILG